MAGVKSNVKLRSYTIDETGKETISESGIYMALSMLLGIAIYMFIALFSGMVMSSVIEEKSSRVVEVLVSSVKASELMFGKIIGVALVALTQFLLWILLTGIFVGIAMGFMGKDKIMGMLIRLWGCSGTMPPPKWSSRCRRMWRFPVSLPWEIRSRPFPTPPVWRRENLPVWK